jgi:thiol-disulfide isomerase/thioredoxin
MSFNKINSISKINDINDYNINKGKDYIIIFFYLNGCGACDMAIPIISKINEKNSNNCTIVKCHGPDIKDDKLNKIYGGKGFPTFKLLKKSNNGYELFNFDGINNNIKFSTLGVLLSDYNKKDEKNNILYYSTENTLKKWIYYSNKYPLSNKNSSANNILNNKTKKLMNYLNFIN